MDHCIWSTFFNYIDGADAATMAAVGKTASSAMLYRRLIWIFVDGRLDDLRPSIKGKSVYATARLRNTGRGQKFRVHCMMDQDTFKHDCSEFIFYLPDHTKVKNVTDELIAFIRSLGIHLLILGQNDTPGANGDLVQDKQQSENTEVTEDIATEENVTKFNTEDFLATTASTEKTHSFEDLLNRWVPLDNFTIEGTTTWPTAYYRFPTDLYKLSCVSNTLPMEQFMYGDFDIDVMVKVNSNKFQAGRIIVSVVPAPVILNTRYTESWYNAVQRTHAFIDVANATAAIVSVPFEYNRAFVRNIEHGQNCAGVDGGIYGSVEIGVASPITAGSGVSKVVTILVWMRIRKAHLAGMAIRIPIAQGPLMRPIEPFLNMLKAVDATASTLIGEDLDKPTVLTRYTSVTPNPAFGWANGKGPTFCDVLRSDPSAKITFPSRCMGSIKHQSLYDIARQWGYLNSIAWSKDAEAGTALISIPLEPAFWSNQVPNTKTFAYNVPPPVSAVARMAQYYTGTFEFRIEFISTTFHSGSVTVSIEFGRESSSTDKCGPYASYNMTFDLGDTKIMEFTVPYIYDTPMRRINSIPYYGHAGLKNESAINKYRTGLVMKVNSKIFVRVANPLRAPDSVVSTIQALVYVRAGKDFRLANIVQNNSLLYDGANADTLPSDKYQPIVTTRTRRGTEVDKKRKIKLEIHRGMNLGDVRKLEEDQKLQDLKAKHLKECEDVSSDVERLTEELREARADMDKKAREVLELTQKMREAEKKHELPCSSTDLTQKLKYGVEAGVWSKILEYKWVSGMRPPIQSSILAWNGLDREQLEATERFSNIFKDVNGEVCVQNIDIVGVSPVRAGSEAWYRALTLNLLARRISWAPLSEYPRAQGPGDSSQEVEHFFQPRSGEPINVLLTSSEMSMWDILRRPVMIQSATKLKKDKAFYIPVLPPQWTYTGTDSSVFMHINQTTPHVAVLSQFRFWRGETRYTIVNRSKNVIYITYLPHSGTRIIGEWSCIGTNDIEYKNHEIMATGNVTTMNVPIVNPVTQVEVPSMTENLWLTMNNGSINDNICWRDKCDDNAGHLVLWATGDAEVDIFWAAGDSFRCGGYIGNVGAQRMRLVDTMTDDNPRAQNFCYSNRALTCGFYDEFFEGRNTEPQAQMWSFFSGSLPRKADIAFSSVTEASNRICEGIEKAEVVTEVAKNFVMGKTEECCSAITKAFDRMLDCWGNSSIKASLVNLSIDIWLAWKTWDVTVVSTLVSKWLISVGVVSWSMLVELVKIVKEWLQGGSEPVAQNYGESLYRKFIRSLIQMSTIYKTSVHGGRLGKLVDRIVESTGLMRLAWLSRTWQAFSDFLACLVSLAGAIWKWLMCEQDPETALITAMTERNGVFLNFVADVNYFLHPEAKKELLMYPSKRLKFYATVAMSYKVGAVLQTVPELRQFNQLATSIRSLQNKASEYSEELMTSPVRYEPYVVCLTGGTNIGKSYYANKLANKLVGSIGYNDYGDTIYVRTPGRDYWDGYTGQPVVVFDDMSNINEAGVNVSTIADLFALKSSAVFIPNMAHLEKKNMKGNPLLVLILTNIPFPDLAEAAHVEAFDRRRDEMYSVQASGEKNPECDHLRFKRYKSVHRQANNVYDFDDELDRSGFEEEIMSKFHAYHVKEQANVRQRLNNFFTAMKAPNEMDLMDYDPYAVVYRALFTAQTSTGASGLMETMAYTFDTYLHHKQMDDIIDYYGKCSDEPTAQNGGEDPLFKFFNSIPTESEDKENLQEELVKILQVIPKDRSFVESGLFVASVVGVTRWKMLFNNIQEFIRNMTGFTVGDCKHCGQKLQLCRKFLCEGPGGCGEVSYCAECIISCRVTSCSCGHLDFMNEKISLTEAFWGVCYYLAKIASVPVYCIVYNMHYFHTSLCPYLEGMAGVASFLSVISILQGSWLMSFGFGLGGVLINYVANRPKFNSQVTTFKNLYLYIREMVKKMFRLGWAYVRRPRPETNGEFADYQPTEQAPIPHCIHVRAGPNVGRAEMWDPEQLLVVNPCRHHDLLKPASTTSIGRKIEWFGVECTHRSVGWNKGRWEYYNNDGEKFELTNGYCKHENCPLRDIKIVQYLLAHCMENEFFRTSTQNRLNFDWDLYNVPCQLLSDVQWDMVNNGVGPKLKKIYNYVKSLASTDWVTYLKDRAQKGWAKTLWFVVLGGSVLVIIIKAVVKLIKIFSGDQEEEEYEDAFGESRSDKAQHSPNQGKNRTRRTVKIEKDKNGQPYAQGVSSNLNSIMAVIYQNIIVIKINDGIQDMEFIAQGVKQNFVLMPRHYYRFMLGAAESGRPVQVKRLQGTEAWYTATVRMDQISQATNSDIIMWNAEVLPPFRDVVKHYPSDDFIENHQIKGDAYIVIPPCGPFKAPLLQHIILKEYVNNVSVKENGSPGKFSILNGIKYNFSCPGACGAPIIRAVHTKPVIGFHSAGCGIGEKGSGWGTVVTSDDIEAMIDKLLPVAQQMSLYEEIPGMVYHDGSGITYPNDLPVLELGMMPPKLALVQPRKTRITTSLVATELEMEPIRIPCPLTADEPPYVGTGTTPLIEGLKHYGKPPIDLPGDFEKVTEPVLSVLLGGMQPEGLMQRPPLTVKEAIVGCPELEYYDAINVASSAGYPWNLKYKDGKHSLMSIDPYSVDPELEAQTITELDKTRRGIVPPTLFVDQLKDEVKDRTKLKQLGKTRLFCMSPVTFTLRMRMLFMHFFAAFMKSRLILHHAIGINPESGEWTLLARNLKAVNMEHIWTVDYKNFGPAYAIRAGRMAMKQMINWTMRKMNYTEEDERAMWVINEELSHSRHIANNCVFQQSCGSPSGSPDTAIKNSLVNMLYVYYFLYKKMYRYWLRETGKVTGNPGGGLVIKEFWTWILDKVYFVTYGDDLIAATSPDILEYVNAVTFTNFYKQYNIVATDASKGESVVPYTTYEGFEFLKRGLIPHPRLDGFYLAPLPEHIIREAAYYVWSGGDLREDTRVNCGASLVLAYTRGPEFYTKWLLELNVACENRGIPGFSMTWDNWNDVFYPPTEQHQVLLKVPTPCSYPLIIMETDFERAKTIYTDVMDTDEGIAAALDNYERDQIVVQGDEKKAIFTRKNQKIRLVII